MRHPVIMPDVHFGTGIHELRVVSPQAYDQTSIAS